MQKQSKVQSDVTGYARVTVLAIRGFEVRVQGFLVATENVLPHHLHIAGASCSRFTLDSWQVTST